MCNEIISHVDESQDIVCGTVLGVTPGISYDKANRYNNVVWKVVNHILLCVTHLCMQRILLEYIRNMLNYIFHYETRSTNDHHETTYCLNFLTSSTQPHPY